MSLSEEEVERIALAVKRRLENPGFVTERLCQARSGEIRKLLWGLYALVAGAALMQQLLKLASGG